MFPAQRRSVTNTMFFQILLLCLITAVPTLELRASIPYGILVGSRSPLITPGPLWWFGVASVCIASNILLGWALYWLLPLFFAVLDSLPLFNRYAEPLISRARRKLSPYVEKYGTVGVALFIGIPLPGSGVYTGSLGAFVLGMGRRKFMLSCVLGVLIAGTAVTAITLLVQAGMSLPFWAEWVIKDH